VTLPRPSTPRERAHLLRYTRPERWPLFERFAVGQPVREQVLAELLAAPPEEVRRLNELLREDVAKRAAELLQDEDFRTAIDAPPFVGGNRIVALGDSLTADRLGWFEIIAETLRQRGGPVPVLANLGVSGNTTADAIERFDLIEAARPTHVLVMLGTNDVRAHGRRRPHRMVRPDETRRNLRVLHELISEDLGVPVTFITPPGGDRVRIERFFAGAPLRWSATDLDGLAELVRDVDANCIDLRAELSRPGLDDPFEDDGVHLSPLGQQRVAAAVVAQLSRAMTGHAGADDTVGREPDGV